MALNISNGISFFLFVMFIPCGFATTSITVNGEAKASHEILFDSLQTRQDGIQAGQSLTGLNVHKKVKVNTTRSIELTGFPLESERTDGSEETSQDSMQILRKSRSESITRMSGEVVEDGNGKEKGIDRIIVQHPIEVLHHFVEPNTHRHQNSVHKRSVVSPPLLFLSILMDYSSNDEEDYRSSVNANTSFASKKPRRAHRSFRTSAEQEHNNQGDGQQGSRQDVNSSFSGLGSSSGGVVIVNTSNGEGVASKTSRIPSLSSSSSCPVGHFECTNNPSLCVPQSAICDGKPECPDGSDEYKCDKADIDETQDALTNKWGSEKEKGEFRELLAKGLCRCSLEKVICHNIHVPNLHSFPKDIQFLDLSGCHFDKLDFPSGRFQVLRTLVLSSCSIHEISSDTFAFLPSLNILHLTGNHLKRLPASVFSGNGNLSKLFLGHNQLETLDSQSFHGLQSLEYLDLRKNRLSGEESKVFHSLSSLRILHLSYNEIRGIRKDAFSGLQHLEMLSLTKNHISVVESDAFNHIPLLKQLYLSYNRLSVLENGIFCSLQDLLNLNLNNNGIIRIEPRAFECLDSLQSLILEKNPFRELDEDTGEDPRQLFVNLTNLQHIYFDEWWMCWWAPHVRFCEPKGDGISSVDNLLDNAVLRACVWIIGVVGVGGNLFVIISRLVIREKNRAHSFYIKNLALADLLMGLFLISIAFHDVSFRGHFLAHQHAWRHSLTCQLSGMLSTLSSEASVFFLFLITLDRYLSIVRPFAERRNALIPAILIVTILWLVSILLSLSPMCPWFRGYFGKSFYTSNGLCLPLHIHNPFEKGWEYSLFLFIVINMIAFMFICYAYWKMLRIIQTSTTSIRSTQQKQDGMLVKRFGLVVFSDFFCWTPIIIIKCIAMAGVEIQSDLYAWLAVFVLPVNSALNPVIYTLSTKLFKQQVSHISAGFRKRFGLATDDSTTSSLLYRNRISRTLQTSLNSSMMRSTRRYGESGNPVGTNSTRVTVLKERMAMGSRTSKVSNCSPLAGHTVAAVSAVTSNISTCGEPIVPNGGRCVVADTVEINGQIVQHQQLHQQNVEGDGGDMIAESEL